VRLTLQTHLINDVAVIRCQGRIVYGAEVDALLVEFEKQTELRKKFVLQLAEADYIDSSGLGALVRQLGMLRATGGDLKLCESSPFVQQVLEVTGLLSVLPTYSSEREAVEAFSSLSRSPQEALGSSSLRILCVDNSRDLLAYLTALLKRSGYEVLTSRFLAEAATIVDVTQPHMVICGPGVPGLPTGAAAIEKFRRSGPHVQILQLPSDFSTSEAGQAGVDLVNRVQALLRT
jgi:stage II sporulation protein AA (anti-sigma F factor antagonist)